MALDALPLDIQELQDRLAQSEKERDFLRVQNTELTRQLRSIAEGSPVSFFWQKVLKDCQTSLPDSCVMLLSKPEEGDEWTLLYHDETNTQLQTANASTLKVATSLHTFSCSPSCPIRQETSIQQSNDWSQWHAFLAANDLNSAVMLNINDDQFGDYLMVVLTQESTPIDERTSLMLTSNAKLIEAALLREQADLLLLEKGHFDPQTGLLRPFSFQHNFSMVLKDSRRHFMRVALISLKLRAALSLRDESLLKDLAGKIQASVRDNDLVAYYGDGEFVMGVCIRNMQDAEVVTAKLLEVMAVTGSDANRLTQAGASIGIAYYPEHSSLEELHRAAAYAASSVREVSGYRIEFHGAIYTTSSEFYTF